MKDNNMRQHWIQFIEKYFPAIVLVMFAISYLSFYALHNTLVSLILFIMTFLFVIPLAIFENEMMIIMLFSCLRDNTKMRHIHSNSVCD